MDIKSILVGISLLMTIVGCTESETLKREVVTDKNGANARSSSASAASENAISVLAKAKGIYTEAKEKEHAWTITANMMAVAEKALAADDEDAALIAAKRALFTARASLTQAETQKVMWQTRVPVRVPN